MCRIIEDGFPDKIKNNVQISLNAGRMSDQPPFNLFIKERAINRHKISFNINFQNIAITVVVFRAGTDKMIHPFDPVMCPFSFTATVTIVDETVLENRRNVVINKMVYDPVAEIGGENFPLYRLVDNKANTWPGLIPLVDNFIV